MTFTIRSISSMVAVDKITNKLLDIGFVLEEQATIVSNGRFWNRMLFVKGEEVVFVSEELGEVYPKDPIISIYGSEDTIKELNEVFS